MEMLVSSEFWIGLLAIIWVNILLSGDNAVVIAMAARSLPPKQRKQAIIWGSVAAIVMRVILTIVAVEMLKLPYLKIVGALLLLWIAIQLLVPEDGGDNEGEKIYGSLFAAIRTIMIADLVMSLDNVIGVAAAAKGNTVLLVLGLAISIPLIVFGSTLILKVMDRFPIIITGGAALLGWIAGDMLVTDPAIAGWVRASANWLDALHVAPIMGAAFVVVTGTWIAKRKPQVPENENA
jgi:YjbE family integral membrane protein